jgi:PAS domain S-box-containing protein
MTDVSSFGNAGRGTVVGRAPRAMPGSKPEPISLTAQEASNDAAHLLVDAGAVLATSLDLTTTMNQVARLTVPRLADLCVIDLRDEDGSIREVAVVAGDERLARELEELRARHRLDPDGDHPVARVIRNGEPQLLPEMTEALLRSFAQGSEHARFMIDHGYHSAVVAPLPARGRTLGALSVLRLGDGEPYRRDDLDLVCELARRAALAIDNARLFSDLQRIDRRLEAILVNLAEAITVEDPDGQTVFANQAAARLLGLATAGELTSAQPGAIMPRFLVLDEHGRELGLEDMPGRRLLVGESPEPLLVRNIVRATGEERWLVVRSSPVIDPETDRIIYAVNVFENITGVKRGQLAESFMAEASRVLAASMEYTATLQLLARLAVPQIADWCAIDVVDDRGEIERVAFHHVDPAALAAANDLEGDDVQQLGDSTVLAEVIRSGEPVIFTRMGLGRAAAASAKEHAEPPGAIPAKSMVIVPMAGTSEAAIGAITLASSESIRQLSNADLDLAVRLGRRAGSAVERARIYTERARIAHLLQRALLPESLPEIPGSEVQALYSAAGELNEVGGDFYDVFDYDSDRWMLVVGDVCGKGPRAAGVTALARHTLRAAALSDQSPTEMLQTLHRALRRQPPGADLCTVCLVTMTPGPGHAQLTIALAGHLPPLLIDNNGAATQVGQPGTILGVIDPIAIHEVQIELHPGGTLLLYTDGVVEAGRPNRQLGEQGLLELCRRSRALTLAGLLERVEQAAIEHADGALHDDIALLGLRLSDRTFPAATASSN